MPYGGMMGGPGGFGGPSAAILGGVVFLVFTVLLIILMVLAIRWLWMQTDKGASSRALEVLKERYARGEIPKEEYEEKKRELS